MEVAPAILFGLAAALILPMTASADAPQVVAGGDMAVRLLLEALTQRPQTNPASQAQIQAPK